MIVHVVMFRPRPTLSAAERERLAAAFTAAVRGIPSIRSASLGERVKHGRGYEALMPVDYSHAAILEFDDVTGLQAYLDHPAHTELGTLFFTMFEEALIYDFDMKEGVSGIAGLLASRS